MVPIVTFLQSYLILFRFRKSDSVYANSSGVFTGINYWMVADKTLHWSRLVLWGWIGLQQLLSIFGIWTKGNLFTWLYVGGVANPVFNAFYITWMLFAYVSANNNNASALVEDIEMDSVLFCLDVLGRSFLLIVQSKNWLQA